MRSISRNGAFGLMAVLVALIGPSSVSAAQITPAGTAFTAVSTSEHSFSVSANVKMRCNEASFQGTTASPAGATATVTAAYGPAAKAGGWCRMYFGGVFTAATVSPSAPWSFTASAYGSGNSTGTIVTSGATTITVGTCVITLPSGTTLPMTGVNDDPSGLSAGLTVSASGSGMSYTTSGCAAWGFPASGSTGTYTGSAYASSIWVM